MFCPFKVAVERMVDNSVELPIFLKFKLLVEMLSDAQTPIEDANLVGRLAH